MRRYQQRRLGRGSSEVRGNPGRRCLEATVCRSRKWSIVTSWGPGLTAGVSRAGHHGLEESSAPGALGPGAWPERMAETKCEIGARRHSSCCKECWQKGDQKWSKSCRMIWGQEIIFKGGGITAQAMLSAVARKPGGCRKAMRLFSSQRGWDLRGPDARKWEHFWLRKVSHYSPWPFILCFIGESALYELFICYS